MSTLGIGPVEILVILAVTLIVFGPQRLPELARYVAKAMKMLREASNELQKQLEMQNWDIDLEDKKKKSYSSSYDGYGYNSSPASSSTSSSTSSSGSDSVTPAAAATESAAPGGYASGESLAASPAESVEAHPVSTAPPAAAEDPAKTGDAHRFARELAD
ncbi:MAG: twin-arginine translocase TatA/TatE family subunit [bacterium]